jgi:protein-disulfide isomerase
MKARIALGAAALALMLVGCGDGGGNLSETAASESAPLEQIPAPDGGDWAEIVSQTDQGFLMGNPDAPVKLVEYASMTCPVCARFAAEASEPIKNSYVQSGQVSFEFRNFILNAPDAAASILARCQAPAAFFRVTDQLFAQQQEWLGAIDETEARRIQSMPQNQQLAALARAMDLDTFFARRGMPEARFNECINDQQAAERLAAMNQRAVNEDGVQGTPTFLINGERVEGAVDWASLEPRLRAALRR